MSQVLLGVNIDHVATLRQARQTAYPNILEAMQAAEKGGADGITVHLREDRRHIQDRDVEIIQSHTQTRLNLEMAVTEPILQIAERIRPAYCCFVPEKRQELTTEGGLDVCAYFSSIKTACDRLAFLDIQVSLFIDPDFKQIEAAHKIGAPAIEIHTGQYANAKNEKDKQNELKRIAEAVSYAANYGLIVNAGHGLSLDNVQPIAALPEINELNIGHAIIARSIFVGLENAVREMKNSLIAARKNK